LKKIFLTTFILVLADQILKIWIKTNMSLGEKIPIFDWFIIDFIENNGMAFGIEFGGLIGKMLLTLFRIIVVAAGIYYIKSIVSAHFPNGALIAIGLIIGGAIGNIMDSAFYGLIFSESYYLGPPAQIFPDTGGYAPLFYGQVVDMFSFPLFTVDLPNWFAIPIPFTENTVLSLLEGADGKFTFFRPVFNIADAGISVGIFLIFLFYRKEFS
tara:strand:+ start:968 stop:1603 length:636 start_codon:yes stop_codon:yes gene_type:complete